MGFSHPGFSLPALPGMGNPEGKKWDFHQLLIPINPRSHSQIPTSPWSFPCWIMDILGYLSNSSSHGCLGSQKFLKFHPVLAGKTLDSELGIFWIQSQESPGFQAGKTLDPEMGKAWILNILGYFFPDSHKEFPRAAGPAFQAHSQFFFGAFPSGWSSPS